MALKKNLLKGEGEGADILFALLQMHAVQNIRTLAFFLSHSARRTLLKISAPSPFSFHALRSAHRSKHPHPRFFPLRCLLYFLYFFFAFFFELVQQKVITLV